MLNFASYEVESKGLEHEHHDIKIQTAPKLSDSILRLQVQKRATLEELDLHRHTDVTHNNKHERDSLIEVILQNSSSLIDDYKHSADPKRRSRIRDLFLWSRAFSEPRLSTDAKQPPDLQHERTNFEKSEDAIKSLKSKPKCCPCM